MSKAQNGTQSELIVLGRDESGSCRAGRFSADQANLVAKAAKAMNLAVCKAAGEALADMAKKLPVGRLYATGRAVVPTVRRTLYEKIAEQFRLAGQQVPDETVQSSGDEAAPGLPSNWDDVAIGNLVIAQESRVTGWWEAIVLARDGDMLTLKWIQYPHLPTVLRHTDSVALKRPGLAGSA
jgi:hypothetical protein